MRIAVLSDIHSNLAALREALEIIDEMDVHRIHCLGDIVGYGGNPNECVELIRARVQRCVLGNHDLAAVDPSHAKYFTPEGRAAAEWTNQVLATEHHKFLQSLPYMLTDDIITLVHASPSQPDIWEYVLTLDDAARQFQAFQTPICFFGHTHIPSVCGDDLKTLMLVHGKKFLINVGSVGQPRGGDPRLSFGILDTDAFDYQNVRIDYPIEKAAEAIRRNKLPESLASRLYRGV